MRGRWALTSPLLILAALGVAVLPLHAAEKPPAPAAVDASVQVTPDPGASRAHTAPVVAVHPKNDRIVAVADADALSGKCGVHVSTNAGLSWAPAAQPAIPAEWPNCAFIPFGPVVDVAFGPDGTLYY